MSQAIAEQANSTIIGYGLSPTVPVGNLGDITGPALKKTMTDVSAHGTSWAQRVGTFLDAGDVKVPVFAVPGDPAFKSLTTIWATLGTAGVGWWTITFADGELWIFQASISDLAIKAPVKGVLTAEVTWAITGGISFA